MKKRQTATFIIFALMLIILSGCSKDNKEYADANANLQAVAIEDSQMIENSSNKEADSQESTEVNTGNMFTGGQINNMSESDIINFKKKTGDTFTDDQICNMTESDIRYYENFKELAKLPENILSENSESKEQLPGAEALSMKEQLLNLICENDIEGAIKVIRSSSERYNFTAPNNYFISLMFEDLSMTRTVLKQGDPDSINPNFLSCYRDPEMLAIISLQYPMQVLARKIEDSNSLIPLVFDNPQYVGTEFYGELPEGNTDEVLEEIFMSEIVMPCNIVKLKIDGNDINVYIRTDSVTSNSSLFGFYNNGDEEVDYKTVDYWIKILNSFGK